MENTRIDSLFLDKEQASVQCKEIFSFIKKVHPFINDGKYHRECLEIRPVKRGIDAYVPSFNVWSNTEKTYRSLETYLNGINGQPVCLYYSIFTLDYGKITYRDNGSKYKKGYINSQNALYTQILAMDFDNISYEDYLKQKEILLSLGIKSISIFTGHGYQDIILLNEKVYDQDIIKKFTMLLIQKGFKVDSKIVDSARVMRLPSTFNCKSFSRETKYYSSTPEGKLTKIIYNTDERYSHTDIFNKLSSLPDVFVEETQCLSYISKSKSLTPIQSDYNMIDISILPCPIQRMLNCTREGLRNSVMMFIIPFFKNTMKYSEEKIIEIMKVWGRRCTPALEHSQVVSETKRIYELKINVAAGTYIPEFIKEFGNMNMYFLAKERTNQTVVIPNVFFNAYNKLPDGAIRIFLTMKYYEKVSKKKAWTIKELTSRLNISASTFYRNIKALIKNQFIHKIITYKKNQIDYVYLLNNRVNTSNGYTTLPLNVIKKSLFLVSNKKLTDGELKLFVYLCYMSNTTNKCWAGQEYLGNKIGKKRNSVCQMIKSLQKYGFLIKDTITSYCKKNNIKVTGQTSLKHDKFLEFISNCYKEDFTGYKKHCIYTFEQSEVALAEEAS